MVADRSDWPWMVAAVIGGSCLWVGSLYIGRDVAPLVPVVIVGMTAGGFFVWHAALGKRWAVIGLYVVATLWISSSFRVRAVGDVGLDWQNGSKFMLSGVFLAIGLFNIRRVMRVCADPAMFCIVLYLALALLSVLYSEAPAVTVVTIGVIVSYLVLACVLVQVLSLRDVLVTTTLMLCGAYCLMNLLSAVVVPDIAITQPFGDEYGRRFQGLSGQPNQLGNVAKEGLLFLIAAAYFGFLRPALWAPMGFIAMVTLILTQSRTSFLALVIACGLQLPRRILTPIIVCVVLIAIGIFVSGQTTNILEMVGRGGNVQDAESMAGRTDLWQFSWGLITDRPWLGYGFNSFESFAGKVWTGDSWAPIVSPHNNYLALLYNGGIIGALPWIAVFAILLYRWYNDPFLPRDLVVISLLVNNFTEVDVPGNSIISTLSLFLVIALDAQRRLHDTVVE